MKNFKKMVLITHDHDVHQTKIFKKDNIQEFYQFAKTEGFEGRGGTSHGPVFDKIETEYWADNDERDNLSMVISLTDNFSDSHEIYMGYKWIKNEIPLMFVLTRHHQKYNYNLSSIDQIVINDEE